MKNMDPSLNPIAEDVPVGTPNQFVEATTDKSTSYSTHLRYSQTRDTYNGAITLTIHIGCYYSGMTWLTKMADHLKAQVTFEAEFGEFEVEKLAGPSFDRMPCLEVRVKFKCSDYEAVAALRKAGFHPGLEYIK